MDLELEMARRKKQLLNQQQHNIKKHSQKRVNFRANDSIPTKQGQMGHTGQIGQRSIKNMTICGSGIQSFFQKNYGAKCQHIVENTQPELRTMHKSYFPTQPRVIVIGDLHGDFDKLIACLQLAKLIELPAGGPPRGPNAHSNQIIFDFVNNTKWVGGNTYVVQLGDQIDRIRPTRWDSSGIAKGGVEDDEGSSLQIFYMLWHLNNQAKSSGGRVICVMGNHEFMNVEGDFRYVSPHEFSEYHGAFNKYYNGAIRPEQEDHDVMEKIKVEREKFTVLPSGYLERRLAWHPRGIVANFMALNYKTIVQIGKWIFCHAGLTMHVVQSDTICKINNCISKYLLSNSPVGANDNDQANNKRIFDKYINCPSDKSPVWCRDFGEDITADPRSSKQLGGSYDLILSQYNRVNTPYLSRYGIPKAEYLAVGHSPQFFNQQGINSILNGKVWRCDVGMSRAFGVEADVCRRPQVLEILNDTTVNVLG